MKRRTLVILGLVAVLFMVCAVCSIAGMLGRNDDKATEEVAEAPAEEPPPAPTATPEPTEAPTNTPIPTEIPTATIPPADATLIAEVLNATDEPTEAPQAESGVPSEVQDYLTQVGKTGGEMATAMSEMGQLLQDLSRFGDQDWVIDVAVQMVTIQLSHEALVELDPPAGMEDFHAFLTETTGQCNDSIDHLQLAIDNLDQDEMVLASELLTGCSKGFEELENALAGL